MAKTQKYTEDQLLEAVVKFSEIEKKKIKATELANWCRRNIEGLEEVRDYHFTRPVKEKDEKTGKMVVRSKLCTLKIEEINKSRSLITCINSNLLLRASNIDSFFEQPNAVKRKMIVETRETVDKLLVRNGNIARENDALKIENKKLKEDLLMVTDKISDFQKNQSKLIKQVNYLMKVTDEESRKRMLSQMGVDDALVSLSVYNNSLQLQLEEVMDIAQTLKRHYIESGVETDEEEKKSGIIKDIMSGIEF